MTETGEEIRGLKERIKVYNNNMWVDPYNLHTQRSLTPHYFKKNSHKLAYIKEWIAREIRALNPFLGQQHWVFFVNLVFDLIKKFNIKGKEFSSHIDVYTHPYTDQFIHELDAFVKSGYTIEKYDYEVDQLYTVAEVRILNIQT